MDKMGRVEVEGFVVDFEAGKFEHLSHNIWYEISKLISKKDIWIQIRPGVFSGPNRRQKSIVEEHNLITL